MDTSTAAIVKLVGDGVLGLASQWLLFGPKKVPQPVAWGILVGLATLLYLWATPTVVHDFSADWRAALVMFLLFLSGTKGFGSFFKSIGFAPASNSL